MHIYTDSLCVTLCKQRWMINSRHTFLTCIPSTNTQSVHIHTQTNRSFIHSFIHSPPPVRRCSYNRLRQTVANKDNIHTYTQTQLCGDMQSAWVCENGLYFGPAETKVKHTCIICRHTHPYGCEINQKINQS